MIYCSGTDEGAVYGYYHGNGLVHDPLAAGCISRIYSGRMTKRLSVNQKPQKEISSLSGITFNAPRFVIIRDAPPLAIKSFTFCLPNHIQYEFNPLQLQQNSITITVILSATIPSSILITSKLHPASPKFSPGLLCAKNRVIKQRLPQNGFLIQDVGTGL